MSRTIAIRADADTQMGAGHLMRCLALAQAFQDAGGRAVFLITDLPHALRSRLERERAEIVAIQATRGTKVDAEQTGDRAREFDAEWAVVDGYQFGGEYQRHLKQAGLKLLALDDYVHADHYWADLVLNQGLHARESDYPHHEPHTRLLCGPRYALLRREFLPHQDSRKDIAERATRVLVTMGGGDAPDTTSRVIGALRALGPRELEVKVVVGALNPRQQRLQRELPGGFQLASGDGMAALMRWADLAIAAAGGTCWELLFVGVPSLVVIQAENQRRNAEELHRRELAVNLGCADQLNSRHIAAQVGSLLDSRERRESMSQRGRELVDGRGAKRVLRALAGRLELRRATADDCRLLWEWANDPEVRRWSFSSAPIPWERHVEWFAARLSDPNCVIWIASEGGAPIGQVRFERAQDGESDISISLDKARRGRGRGADLMNQGAEEYFAASNVHRIRALIKPDNVGSIRALEAATFSYAGRQIIRGAEVLCYVRNRQD